MRFRDIVAALKDDTQLPIVPDRLAQLIKSDGIVEQIVFVGVDLDTKILRGKFARVMYDRGSLGSIPPPYAIPESGLVMKVYYARNQEPDEVRLVINKELLHSVDPDVVRIASREQAISLANKLRLPLELLLASDEEDSPAAILDCFSDLRAVAAMVPEPVRILVCEKHQAGKIDESEIADFLGIPRRYVSAVLSDRWERMLKFWLRES